MPIKCPKKKDAVFPEKAASLHGCGSIFAKAVAKIDTIHDKLSIVIY